MSRSNLLNGSQSWLAGVDAHAHLHGNPLRPNMVREHTPGFCGCTDRLGEA